MSTFAITGTVNIDSLTRIGLATGLTWTRSGTTATVTQTAHGLANNDLVNVTNSSATTPLPNGLKTITVVNANSYTFTAVNSGATSGTLDAEHLDDFAINGGTLTVDQDSRYGTNANTRSIMNDIIMSATLGGTILFDARKVRLIPYDGASGNVPAAGTTIAGASGSGLLIGVYADLASAPTAAGNSMPASGFIKIKQWNDAAFVDNEALSGLTANVNGTDRVGWIEIVGTNAGTSTVNRLNSWQCKGDWYEVGTTDGTRATTYQIPSNGSAAFYFPGVWVETGASTNVYEFYPMAGVQTALLANVATDVRGKVCWISTSGVLRFGHDGTNSTGGYLPVTGCRIRVPNVFFMCCTQTALTVNVLPNATLATRADFTTTGGGVIDIEYASMNWYLSANQAYSVDLLNSAFLTQILVSEIATAMTWDNIGVGLEATTANPQFALSMTNCFAGGTITNGVFASASLAASGRYMISLSTINDFDFVNCKTVSLTPARGNATTGAITATRMVDCTWTGTILGSGRFLLTTCSNCTFTNTSYFDAVAGNTTATNPMYAFDLSSSCLNTKIDGIDFLGLYLTQPYNGLLQVGAAGCINTKLRNVGTYASPLSLGSPRVDDAAWTRVTTTATITSVAHGLVVNDTIYVVVSSDTAAITVAAKTVVAVPTADTFTFACLNAGAASGTICYFGTKCANVFLLANGAAANNVEIKRVYAPHTRTNLYTADNSSKNILLANVFSDYLNVPVFAYLNGFTRNVSGTSTFAAQTAVYGTHWFNGYVCDVNDSGSATWTRSGSTITVTSANHRLRTGLPINVMTSSDATAATLGYRTVTAISSSTFTFTGAATGATSGTLTYRVGNGRIAIMMNEPTAETTELVSIDAGTPAFTSAGGLVMATVNDQVTFTTPEYILGQGDSFPNMEAVMGGGTLTNYDVTYSLDKNDGNGYGSFHNLSYPRAGAGGSNGSTTITMTSTTGVEVGDYVWGTNVGPNAQVQSIDSGTAITVTVANIGTVSGTLRFNHLPSESGLGPDTGIKMKVRIKTSTASATAITSLYWWAESTTTGRAYQYPLDLVPLTLTGLKNPTEVRVFEAGTTTEIAGQESVTSGTFTTDLDSGAYPEVDISILSLGYQNTRLLGLTLGDGLEIPVQQIVDRQYLNP